MIISIGEEKNPKCSLHFGMHSGMFHCDEVVGIAILEMAHLGMDAQLVRTRDLEMLKQLDIVIDIGGGMFDHHMAGFNLCRATGEKYASAGLVWQAFAEKAIKNAMAEEKIIIGDEDILAIKDEIDREVIIPVDLEDNGEKVNFHLFSFVPSFVPTWCEENPDYDSAFGKAEKVVFEILRVRIRDKIVRIATKKELQKRYNNIEDGILEIPAQTMPWLNEVLSYNEEHNHRVKFVIFPYPAGGWAAQCVPPSIKEKFEQLVPFPKEWAGADEKSLPEISGIPDATFCHNGCFFIRATTKQSIIEMCKIALLK